MKILFIGNSYTYYNDLPKLFENLARENGIEAEVDSITVGGRRLYENLLPDDEKNSEITSLIQSKSYDVLVLQEQSYTPMTQYKTFEYAVDGLVKLIKPSRTVLYATWGRKEGSPLLDEHKITSAEMTQRLAEAYKKAAESISAELSRVGECFEYIRQSYPELELYDPDLSHPSYNGSALATLSHYRAIFGELSKSISSLKLKEAESSAMLEAIETTIKAK